MTAFARFCSAALVVLAFDIAWPSAYRFLPGWHPWLAPVLTAISLAIPLWAGALLGCAVTIWTAAAWTAGLGVIDATLGWALSLIILPKDHDLGSSPWSAWSRAMLRWDWSARRQAAV